MQNWIHNIVEMPIKFKYNIANMSQAYRDYYIVKMPNYSV